MNPRALLFGLFALGLAAGTAYTARNLVAEREQARPVLMTPDNKAATTVDILVARSEIVAGGFVRRQDLAWQPWPERNLQPSYVVRGKEDSQETLEAFEGAVVRSRIAPGEPITSGRVVKPGEGGFLAAVLQPGQRALAVKVDGTSGIAGLVKPGDLVDVVLTLSVGRDTGRENTLKRASETIVRAVRVVAVDQTTSDSTDEQANRSATRRSREPINTATLELTPKQVEIVTLGAEMGSLSLSLRSLAVGEEAGDAPPRGLFALLRRMAAGPGPTGEGMTLDHEVSRLLSESTGPLVPPALDGFPGVLPATPITMTAFEPMTMAAPLPETPKRSVTIMRGRDSTVVEFKGAR